MYTFLKKKSLETVFIHAICWLIFICYELGFLYFFNSRFSSFNEYIIYYAINILFFYAVVSILNYIGSYSPARLLRGILLYALLVSGYFLVKFVIQILLESSVYGFRAEVSAFRRSFLLLVNRGIYFSMLAIFYWLAARITIFRKKAVDAEMNQLIALKEVAQLEASLVETRNAYLQQQMSPHMLFNALNFIYSSIHRNSPEGARCVILLSDIMRVSLAEAESDGKIPLSEEVIQIERLLEINHLRFGEKVSILFYKEGEFDKLRIIPLILFTLAENVMKHGHLNDITEPAQISIIADVNGRLEFKTTNRLKPKTVFIRNRQIGLQNVRIRLEFAYNGYYELFINESEKLFELKLILQL